MQTKSKNLYQVNIFRNGFCYRTCLNCTWKEVVRLRRFFKNLGETIEYEKM